jgi:hypothetical protein
MSDMYPVSPQVGRRTNIIIIWIVIAFLVGFFGGLIFARVYCPCPDGYHCEGYLNPICVKD